MLLSTVDTVPIQDAHGGGGRKLFYAQSLHWFFYISGGKIAWKTSPDGITWSSVNLTAWSGNYGDRFAAMVDDAGQYVHLAREFGGSLVYYRGLLGADGSITWDAVQTIHSGFNWSPVLELDSNGFPWVTYRHRVNSDTRPYVSMSTTKDGTWTTGSGFPYELHADNAGWGIYPIRLSGGNFYILYSKPDDVARGRLYTAGVGMGAEEIASTNNSCHGEVRGVSDENDTIHLIFNRENLAKAPDVYEHRYCSRSFATGVWSSEECLYEEDVDCTGACVCIDEETQQVYDFYYNSSGNLYVRRRSGENWGAICTISTGETFTGGLGSWDIITFARKNDSFIGIGWARDNLPNYDLRYGAMILLKIATQTVKAM